MTEEERETHSPQQQRTNTSNKTAPLATSAFYTTEQSTGESTVTRQGSSVTTDKLKGNQKTPFIIPTETTKYPLHIVDTVTGATGVASSTIHQSTRGLSTPHSQGLSNEVLAGGIAGGLTVLILIGLLLLAVVKRRKTGGLVFAQSNTETSFDNLGFNGGRKISEFMDLTELELVRVKFSNTVKRKISAFTKEDQKTRQVSCGRLEVVEVPANTNIDSDVLLTTWV